jgi:peptide/nickel transport system substrate-binding protein
MRRLADQRRLLTVAAAGVLALGLAACGSSGSGGGSSKTSSSSGSSAEVTMESSPETTITQAFNPFIATQAAYTMGADGLIYEPLYQFDLASPTISYPWLATGYKWGDGGKQITFTIRSGVKWNNGSPFTAADVAYTFGLVKKTAAINLGGLAITGISSTSDTVTLSFATPQYTNLEEIAGTAIVPKAIWSKAGNPATYADSTPVGTGPYMLDSFTPQGFTLKKNPYYWQASKVKVAKVYFPVYTTNTGALSALFSDQITWTGNYIPGLQKDFVAKDPAYHHYWEAAGGTNSLMPNLNKWPTNQLVVRKAISLAINRTLIGSEGEAGLENPVTSAAGLTQPTYSAWGGPVASLTNSATAQPAAAEKLLEANGYTKSNGVFQKDGKPVAITLIDPAAYTDYASDDQLIAQELKQAGIDCTFQGIATTAWATDVADGDFDLTLHWSNGGLTPYNMYNGWLNSALGKGNSATGDYERLNDPALDTDLAKLSAASTVAAQTTALVPLEKYVAQNVPIIPTTTAAEWFEYNSQDFVGWPTQSNPYDTGQPSGSNNGPGSGTDEVVLLHLSPR